jgi:hypothetical protein
MQFEQIPISQSGILLTITQGCLWVLVYEHVVKFDYFQKLMYPFGIIFNPISMEKNSGAVVTNTYFLRTKTFLS